MSAPQSSGSGVTPQSGKFYNPVACGALCSECPLKGHQVVAPETNPNTKIAVVGKFPSDGEVKQQRLFVGPSGTELDRALRLAGVKRYELHVTNTILCQPPDGDLEKLNLRISRDNKKNGTQVKTPEECCAPRLHLELNRFTNVIALGKVALSALTGRAQALMPLRGAMQDIPAALGVVARRIMPTLHPEMVMSQQRWAHVFRNDVHKAIRHFRGQAQWVPPEVIYNPSPAQFREFIEKEGELYTYDIETDGIECLTAHIRCIAVGNSTHVMVVGFRSNKHPKDDDTLWTDFYTPDEAVEITEIFKEFFQNPRKIKVGQNISYYDRLVIRSQLNVETNNIVDTMMLHRSVESELPHGLGYLASIYTDAPSWKQDHAGNKIALGGESDEQLHEYCAMDTALTARILSPLVDAVDLRKQTPVYHLDMKIAEICADMHAAGMYVDQESRHKLEVKMLQDRHTILNGIRDRLEMPNFNPGSVNQMRDLLFDRWGLSADVEEKDKITKSGDLSTGDLILRVLLTDLTVPEPQREVIKMIRRYRKLMKVLGTYVVKMRPSNMGADLGWDEDEEYADKEARKKYGETKVGIVDPRTGRMHPGYNAAVTVTGRLSSSKPINAQNYPKAMRKLVIAAPGNILVGADMDQLELRIAAARWGVTLYKRAFEEGKDPHSMTAYAVFGAEFCKAAGVDEVLFHRPGMLIGRDFDATGKFIGTGDAMRMRSLSKAIQYASQYMAKVETVHKLIQKTELPSINPDTGKAYEDGRTDLPYAKMLLSRVRGMRDNWLKGAPEFEYGWEQELQTYRDKGFIAEDITGRRRDFLDGEAPNEIVNFPIQCVPGHVRVITKHGYLPIRDLVGKVFLAWTGKEWAPATCISKGKARLNEVRTNHALNLICDDTHKLLVPQRSEYGWVEVSQIETGNRVAIDLARELEFGAEFDAETAYILGFFIADGSISRKEKGRGHSATITFAVGNTTKSGRSSRCGVTAVNRIKAYFESCGLACRVTEYEGHTSVAIDSNCLVWAEQFGISPAWGARDKRIPNCIWSSNLAARKQFILGVLDGDGYQNPDNGVILNMFNYELLHDIAVISRTVGIDSTSLRGPYKTNAETETVSWKLNLSASQVNYVLNWGEAAKYRSNNTLPQFECSRIHSRLQPQTESHRTLKSRIRGHAGASSMTPYSAVAMGVEDLYDHAVVSSVVPLDIETEVFTLCVDHPSHSYVSDGFISKNSSAAGLMNLALIELHRRIPYGKWGKGTGIINQCHDSIVVECPESEAAWVARQLEECMNQVHDALPGVKYSASASIGKTWKDVG